MVESDRFGLSGSGFRVSMLRFRMWVRSLSQPRWLQRSKALLLRRWLNMTAEALVMKMLVAIGLNSPPPCKA